MGGPVGLDDTPDRADRSTPSTALHLSMCDSAFPRRPAPKAPTPTGGSASGRLELGAPDIVGTIFFGFAKSVRYALEFASRMRLARKGTAEVSTMPFEPQATDWTNFVCSDEALPKKGPSYWFSTFFCYLIANSWLGSWLDIWPAGLNFEPNNKPNSRKYCICKKRRKPSGKTSRGKGLVGAFPPARRPPTPR